MYKTRRLRYEVYERVTQVSTVDICLLDIAGLLGVCDFSGLQDGPSESFVEACDSKSCEYCNHELHPASFSLIMFGFSSPRQETCDVLRHLRLSCFSAVFVLHLTVNELFGHCNGCSGEVRVVVKPR